MPHTPHTPRAVAPSPACCSAAAGSFSVVGLWLWCVGAGAHLRPWAQQAWGHLHTHHAWVAPVTQGPIAAHHHVHGPRLAAPAPLHSPELGTTRLPCCPRKPPAAPPVSGHARQALRTAQGWHPIRHSGAPTEHPDCHGEGGGVGLPGVHYWCSCMVSSEESRGGWGALEPGAMQTWSSTLGEGVEPMAARGSEAGSSVLNAPSGSSSYGMWLAENGGGAVPMARLLRTPSLSQ